MPNTNMFQAPNPEFWMHPEKWRSAPTNSIGNLAISGEERILQEQAAEAFVILLDPDGTLPDISLKADENRAHLDFGPWQGYDIKSPEGLIIGYVNLSFDTTDNMAYFADIKLGRDSNDRIIVDNNTHRPIDVTGKGYGLGTYKRVVPEAIKQGYGFKSNPKNTGFGLSKDGLRMWQHLEAAGIARITEPGKVDPTGPTYSYSTTRFGVLSPAELISKSKER